MPVRGHQNPQNGKKSLIGDFTVADSTGSDSRNTPLAKALSALRRAEERATTGLLALEVMHEIRNPLEALNNLVYLAVQAKNDPPAVHIHLNAAQEQIKTLNAIAHEILGYSRSANVPKPVRVAAVAEAALRIHRRTIEAKNIRIESELPDDVVAELRKGEVLQVVSNVIKNALDALPSGGTLRLRLRRHGGEVQFVIADNGAGIPKENLDEIFQPFFTTKGENGTGLGLSLSKAIVERHGGRIRIRSSVRPGKSGTAFKISLPAVSGA
jgi:signal transduction histidine kinase